jgi:hypothetical protein
MTTSLTLTGAEQRHQFCGCEYNAQDQMADLVAPLDGWLRFVRTHVLGRDPNENMLLFPLAEAQSQPVSVEQLAAFLAEAFREYSKLAARAQLRGFFYAWVDDQAGQLRCSFHEAETAGALPFRCTIVATDDPTTIAAAALSSPYAYGIPFHELKPIDESVTDESAEASEPRRYELTVFARRVVTPV